MATLSDPEPRNGQVYTPDSAQKGGGGGSKLFEIANFEIAKNALVLWLSAFLAEPWPFSTVAIENSTGSGPSINSRIPHQFTTPVQPDLLQKMVPYKNSNLPQTPCISRSPFHPIFKNFPPSPKSSIVKILEN